MAAAQWRSLVDGLGWSRHEWLTLAAMIAVNFSSGIASSIYIPFYPQEAEKRGVPASEYGLAFGVYELVAFAVCLIHGKYMDRIGPKFLVTTATIISGLASIAFGFLQLATSHHVFITGSLALMTLESAATSAAFTSSYAIASIVFSKKLATTVAVLECFYGLGFALGPTFGGYLYEVGGFMSPFDAMGMQFLAVAAFISVGVPQIERAKDTPSSSGKILPILKMTDVLISLLTLLCAYVSMGYLLTTLEPHLRQFELPPSTVGVMFAVSAVAYILTTPVVGWLCDSCVDPRKMMLGGALLMVVGFSFIGPFPYLPINTELWMVSVGLALHGLAMSCSVVPGFMDAIQSAIGCGMPDGTATYCVVTALSTAAVALGEFIGPSAAGLLLDAVGFRRGSLLVFSLYLLLIVCLTWQMVMGKSCSSKSVQAGHSHMTSELTSVHSDRVAVAQFAEGSDDKLQLSRVIPFGPLEGKYRSE